MRKILKTFILTLAALTVCWMITTFAFTFIVYASWCVMSNSAVAFFLAYELLSNLLSLNAITGIAILTVVYVILLIIGDE